MFESVSNLQIVMWLNLYYIRNDHYHITDDLLNLNFV